MLDMPFMSARIARNHFDCLIMSGSRLTRSIHRPHLQRQIAPTAWISSFLCTFPIPPDVEPVHAPRIELMREVPFDFLPPPSTQPELERFCGVAGCDRLKRSA